jgi:Family of unknown function (DUF6494)
VDEEALNLSVRKFLKQLGITAQREIEKGVRDGVEDGRLSGDDRLRARATVRVDGLDEEIVVEGEIALDG